MVMTPVSNAQRGRRQEELAPQHRRGIALDVPVVGGRGDDAGRRCERQHDRETHPAKRHRPSFRSLHYRSEDKGSVEEPAAPFIWV